MKVDVSLGGIRLADTPAHVRQIESEGFDGVTTNENKHDPFAPLVLAAANSERLALATSVAIAFPRSPMVVANTSWDLQTLSQGRFRLGLGTQVKGHNQRRFSVPWSPPLPRLREYVQALRAIWDNWQNGTKLDFRGEHYQFTLMPPYFVPERLGHYPIPVEIAAVGEKMCRLVGEVCDGIRLHSFNTPTYLRAVILPAIREGAARTSRDWRQITVHGSVFTIAGETPAEREQSRQAVRGQIAFYASTRTYKPVLDQHGWGDICLKLNAMAAQGRWNEMADEIGDEVLAAFAVEGRWDEIVEQVRAQYGGLMDRASLRVMGIDEARARAGLREVLPALQAIPTFQETGAATV